MLEYMTSAAVAVTVIWTTMCCDGPTDAAVNAATDVERFYPGARTGWKPLPVERALLLLMWDYLCSSSCFAAILVVPDVLWTVKALNRRNEVEAANSLLRLLRSARKRKSAPSI